ncbi:hypothetical protein [Carboxylicivirga sp. RSCT41]|uniref:hypothetical protein n=1 Tax=Carboxylicivirga agarovorans TaxID=3417570 RepID=UPI003D3301A0
MNELRSFLIASAGTLGLLEVTNSEQLLPTDSDPETLALKALITLVAGLLSTFLTRIFRKNKDRSSPKDQSASDSNSRGADKNNLSQTLKNK